ncbi:hypothetical protein O6H91_23G004100 [Diphasiastrum complanatum]|nr:hypothetical protein O6H91_23G004100 [Diphasiastrum complanatum]
MLKVLAVKAAASGFHRAAYFDRIQDCLFNQFLLETLSAPPTMAKVCDSAESQSADFEETVTLSGVNRSHSNSSKATPNTAARCAISTDDEIQKATREQPRSMQGDFASHKQHSRGKVNQILHGAIQGRHRQAQAGVLAKRACLTDGKHELNADPKRLQGSENSPNKARNLESSNQAGGRWPSGGFDKPTLGVDEHTLKPASHTSGNTENRITPRQASETMAANESFEAAQQQQTPTQRRMSASIGPLIALSSNPIEQDKLQQLTSETVSAWTLKRLIKVIRHTNIATYTSMFAHEKGDWEIDSEVRAKAAAKQVLAVVLFIASLLILGVDTSKLLVFFSSIFIPSVFIFGNAAKTTFEALIFLFIIHPFDVGDRISVDGQTMLVEEMNVLNTTFLSGSNEKIYYPNSVLANKAISNFYRSPDQCDGIEFQVHVSTSIEKLGALKERMQSYIESLPQFWYPDFGIICKDIEDHNKMKMGLWMQHHLNFQEAGERYQRRSNLLLYMKQQLEDLGIGYQLPKQEIIVRGLPLHIMSSSKQWLL